MVNHRTEMPDRLRHLYEKTNNPLYVWEAIANCLSADRPIIPNWCIPYLHQASVKLTHLASGHNFNKRGRGGDMPRISPDKAMRLVPEALTLSRQGKRNAFANLLNIRRDADDARMSLTEFPVIETFMHNLALQSIEIKRSVTRDRAQRIIARGKKLLHSR